jgi:hypothetical protein
MKKTVFDYTMLLLQWHVFKTRPITNKRRDQRDMEIREGPTGKLVCYITKLLCAIY